MAQPTRIDLNHVLIGDELGQIKLVQLHSRNRKDQPLLHVNNGRKRSGSFDSSKLSSRRLHLGQSNTLSRDRLHNKYRVVRVLDDCIQREPSMSRAITSIRPITSIHQSDIDSTDKPNSLFIIANKVGQLFVCDTDAIRARLARFTKIDATNDTDSDEDESSPMLSPVYYNMDNKVQICGAQPINRTNILVIYQDGKIQQVDIGQDVLQSSLKIKRKAIRMLGLGYNSDAKAVRWRIDGSSGICYYDSNATAVHLNESDPIIDLMLSSPTSKLTKKRIDASQQNQYNKPPCIKSRKYNETDRLVPTQVISMITSRVEHCKSSSRMFKWSSISSLNVLYRKLALWDLVRPGNYEQDSFSPQYSVNCFKLNDNRLALGGSKYALRVYDVQSQKAIYNCKTGSSKNPLACSSKGEPYMIGDIDWLAGNKTIENSPNLLATCSGIDSVVHVYDLRSPKPVFYIDLTEQTEDKWKPYENYPRGCKFTKICASAAPYSTAVPSQQLALGSTNGQLHLIDLRFVSRSHMSLGKLSGFCGGSTREIRFVSESLETSKMISCATDRFIRIHRIQTSFTSVISQKLATKIFLGTKPTSIQPVCDKITQSYLSNIESNGESDSHRSSTGFRGLYS